MVMVHRPGMTNFLTTDIYALTAEEYSMGRSNVEVVKLLIKAGIKVIQYREKNKQAGAMYEECLTIRNLTKQARVTFIINDHVDLALLVGADGIHLGQEDLPPLKVRELIGNEMILGLSTHTPEQAKAAATLGCVDYIGVGPVFSTNTKKGVCQAVGFSYLDYIVKNLDIPFVAIGGIKEHNIMEVKRHGANIMALITELVGAADIPAKVRAIRQALNKQ
ncbi:thiamine phosphate synthase [Sporomusa acidovorans]|uniref:Thiamine-phosphate synthase n=1 Tax=Sporomusa acidovorans (strain ATCC 49682 / DSM 3132 / Mol) TaxID=1123286 RepID=A0ABZ3J4X8_SPOA4|nr:thiamine phosphate synthase [Sporomusa acidovorans]OZC20951.1 thiamine-phosphate synthase [Sporomusa acidovorans DSM 3132]SDE62117.1 thiamine-phosphate diphosphorylase [Sporomusa acidovorans]